MTQRGNTLFARRFASVFTASAIAFGTIGFGAQIAVAAPTTIQVPGGLCSYQPMDKAMIKQIKGRADFADVLAYLEKECPDVAALFVGPTGTVAVASAGGATDSTGGGDNGGGNGGGGDNGGGDNGNGGGGGGDNGGGSSCSNGQGKSQGKGSGCGGGSDKDPRGNNGKNNK